MKVIKFLKTTVHYQNKQQTVNGKNLKEKVWK